MPLLAFTRYFHRCATQTGMSQLFHTPRKMRQRNRTTVNHVYKSSTPYKNVAMKRYSISLSEIGTGSSSSAGEIRKKPRPQITGDKDELTQYS